MPKGMPKGMPEADTGTVSLAASLAASLALGLGMLRVANAAQAQPERTVVELFTSEGCSSCPPAEAMLGELAQRDDVIALAFHVDYWDDIGWRDRFALKEATQRQRNYARALHLPSVYTPQLVIDGVRDVVGGADSARVLPIKRASAGFPVTVGISGDQLRVDVGVDAGTDMGANAAHPSADVLLVSYLPEAVSKPNRGENAGQELHEFNLVRSIRTLGPWNGAAKSYTAPLSSLPADASRVAVLVQLANNGAIVGSAARSLR